jgi:hypothetical protein
VPSTLAVGSSESGNAEVLADLNLDIELALDLLLCRLEAGLAGIVGIEGCRLGRLGDRLNVGAGVARSKVRGGKAAVGL